MFIHLLSKNIDKVYDKGFEMRAYQNRRELICIRLGDPAGVSPAVGPCNFVSILLV